MFTGIIETRGIVLDSASTPGLTRITIETDALGDVAIGGSVSVNGVCLTAVDAQKGSIDVEVVAETLSRTNLGSLTEGDPVNLELPMRADGRFDGHIVQGHVDGVGTVKRVGAAGESRLISIEPPMPLMKYLVEKGSVCVDGISLTVAKVGRESFEVAVIPHTMAVTTLGLRKPGDTVNLEVDVLAKYVERLLEAGQ
jgi:riboflavin synthase